MYFALATGAKTEVAWRGDCCSGWRGPGAGPRVVGNAILAIVEKIVKIRMKIARTLIYTNRKRK
jgi:hypothetical protein